MGKCRVCGKQVLFRSKNDPLCRPCKKKLLEDSKQEAELFFEKVKELNKKIGLTSFAYSEGIVNVDINTEYEDLDSINGVISDANKLLELLPKYEDIYNFRTFFKQQLTAYAIDYEFYAHPAFPGRRFNISVPDSVDLFMEQEIRIVKVAKAKILEERECLRQQARQEEQRIQREKTATNFQALLGEIPVVDVSIDPGCELSPSPALKNRTFEPYTLRTNTPLRYFSTFVVIDLETTGLDPVRNEIIQLCAVRFEGGVPTEAFLTYVSPDGPLNEAAQKINGITEQHLVGAPKLAEVATAFKTFVGTYSIVAHNLNFDLRFLACAGILFGPKNKLFDTLLMARSQYSTHSKFSLSALCEDKLGLIRSDEHSALSDAVATGILFVKMVKSKVSAAADVLNTMEL